MTFRSIDIKTIFEEDLFIHSYQIDKNSRLTLPGLCDLLQEIAWAHSASCHIGFDDLLKMNLFWVLSRLMIKVKCWPLWREQCTLKTWSIGPDGAFARREFSLLDAKGEEIITATSLWLIIDAQTRRLQRITNLNWNFPYFDQKVMDIQLEKLPDFTPDFISEALPVQYSDLDVNQHVNNTRYIRRIIDSYDFDFLNTHEVKEFEINFMKEARPGDQMKVERQLSFPLSYYATVRSDTQEFVRTRILWKDEE
ncbi:MAG: thioesterase [Bacteroidota bacterium]|nr:thioesterase [Bacteroidota bacterium]